MTSYPSKTYTESRLFNRQSIVRSFVRYFWLISISSIIAVLLFVDDLQALQISDVGMRKEQIETANVYKEQAREIGGKVSAGASITSRDRLHLPRSGEDEYVNISWGLDTQLATKDTRSSPGPPVYDPPATQIQVPDVFAERQGGEEEVTAWSAGGIPLVVDKIYWSEDVEKLLPKGFSDDDVDSFVRLARIVPVSKIEPALWNRCGRPKNQFITLEDGTKLCARYRHPQNALIQGEVLSFYLSKLLGLDSVPSVALSRLDYTSLQWRGQDLNRTDWVEGTPVALIQWIDDLGHDRSHVKMPTSILFAYEHGSVLNGSSLQGSLGSSDITAGELIALIQWTDLILFDYIIGHYDRVASMQDGADRESKPSILHENIRNLRQVWQAGKLVLLDNESGLLDGYELMYRGRETGQRFLDFHRCMLRSVCLFRRHTVAQIRMLASRSEPERTLLNYASAQDPLFATLGPVPELDVFRTYFRVRLKEVAEWISDCEQNATRNVR